MIILISKEKEEVTNIDSRTKCNICKLYISKNQRRKTQYDLYENLNNTGDIEIYVENDNGESTILDLPENLQKRIGEFIAVQNNLSATTDYNQKLDKQEVFDCSSFVHYIHNIKETDCLSDSWDVEEFDPEKLEVGDVVLTGYQKGDTIIGAKSHYSIYIGDNKYIGKFGPYSMGITITTLEEIGKFYPYNKAFLLKAKS